MDRDVLRLEWPCFQFQRLGLSEKIPSVVVNSLRPRLDCSCDLVCCCALFVCYLCDSLGSSKMAAGLFISPCEVILDVIAMNE